MDVFSYIDEFKRSREWAIMQRTVENSAWHREANVAVHTEMVMEQYITRFAPLRSNAENTIGLIALLYHDVGKPMSQVAKTDGSGANSYPGHEPRSGVLFAQAYVQTPALRVLLSAAEARAVRWIIEHHLPYGLKDTKKRLALRNATAETMRAANVTSQTFYDCLRSDSAGRISDNHAEKLQAVEDWINQFSEIDVMWSMPVEPGSTAFILVGAPGAGKSTWTKAHLNANDQVFSTDDLKVTYFQQSDEFRRSTIQYDDTKALYKAAWQYCSVTHEKEFLAFAFEIAQGKFRAGSILGYNLFIDLTNTTKKKRKPWVAMARENDMKIVGVEFWNSLDTVVARQSTRPEKSVPASAVAENFFALSSCWVTDEVDEVVVVIENGANP